MIDSPAALVRALTAVACVAVAASCGGSDDSDSVTFAFRMRGLASSEEFRIPTQSAQLIDQARAQLRVPEEQRRHFPSGSIARGDGGYNLRWRRHLTDARLVDVAIEVCDGRPSMVEENIDYWIDTVKRFCPWDAYVHAEIPS